MHDEVSDGADAATGERRHGRLLRDALRRARAEAAERADVVIDLRQAEIARLEILQDALAPVFRSVPPEVDLFDVGLTLGERPRLFVDMVAFVEMGRDRKVYRFLCDGRSGRSVVAESETVEPMVEAVTAYVARRLVERERLLADDDRLATAATHIRSDAPAPAQPAAKPREARPHPASAFEMTSASASRPHGLARALAVVAAFAIGGGLGAAVVIGLMVAAAKGVLPGVG